MSSPVHSETCKAQIHPKKTPKARGFHMTAFEQERSDKAPSPYDLGAL